LKAIVKNQLCYLLLVVGCIQIATMPSMFYPGDNYAPRMEAMHWVMRGSLGVPYSERQLLGGLLSERGQYFYENDEKERFFSRYGFGSTFMYIVPVWLDFVTGGKVGEAPIWQSQSLLLWINIWQILFTLWSVVYLYLLARFYTKRGLLASAFVILCIYPSIAWHYFRSPALEIFQIPMFLGMMYHAIRFLRADQESDPSVRTKDWLHMTACVCLAGLLVSQKLFYVIVAAFVFGCLAFSGPKEQGVISRLHGNIRLRLPRFLLFGALPWLVVSALILWGNDYRFGDPFDTGFGQWIKEGQKFDRFGFAFVPLALSGFFVQFGGKNIWMHFPLFVFGVFAGPWFLKRYTREAVLALGVVLLIIVGISGYRSWAGEWSYGPRLVLFAGMLGGLGVVPVAEALLDQRRRLLLALSVPVLVFSLWSLVQQVHINKLHPFVWHYAHSQFSHGGLRDVPGIKSYHDSIRHRATLYRDVRLHARGKREYPPYRALRGILDRHPDRDAILRQFDGFLQEMGKLNMWFANDVN
jgi:hypothetical protein